jgi:chemotaxis protein MotB
MKIIYTFFLSLIILLPSCVSQSTFDAVVSSRDSLSSQNDSLRGIILDKLNNIDGLSSQISQNRDVISGLQRQLMKSKENYRNVSEKLTGESKSLLNQLERLQAENIDLKGEIGKKQRIIDGINQKLNSRNSKMDSLKSRISEALLGFTEKGLAINIRDGKVYVSLSNQLLFKSGSIQIDSKGKDALTDLSKVLNENIDIKILVEGHTDDQAVKGSSHRFKDNWELSVLRATEVVKFLQKNDVLPSRIIASGRGEFMPVDTSDSKTGRATNRRTEIILTPDMEEIFEIIEN